MEYIPTLEYHQMAGRAGRPDFNDSHGEAICIAGSEKEAEDIAERFINADAENIYSKLAVEPVLRTYCLSLLATGFAVSRGTLVTFFEKTFYGHQYGDMDKLGQIIDKILGLLEEWGFVVLESPKDDFVSANQIDSDSIKVTRLGERVAQLYIDPYTAHHIITALRRGTQMQTDEFSLITLACSTFELRPLSNARVAEIPKIEQEIILRKSRLIIIEPSVFEPEYDQFVNVMKLSLVLESWMDEKGEDEILEELNIPPGELYYKKDLCDWILHACDELSELLGFREIQKVIRKTQFRLDKGVKEELIPLVRLKNIGRVRARLLFRNGIKDIGDIKNADQTKLSQLLGAKVAQNLKEQVGEEVEEVSKGKRKGQLSIEKY
jgi:helicase